jgi:hypothetical protein
LVPTVFFPLSVAYALLKYSLFDLGNSLKVGLSRIALTAFLLAMYALVVFLLAPWVSTESDPFVPLFFSVLVVVVFNPLLRWIETVVDRCLCRIMTYVCKKSVCFRSLAPRHWLSFGEDQMGIETVILVLSPETADEPLMVAGQSGAARADVADGVRMLTASHGSPYHRWNVRGEVTRPRFQEKAAMAFSINGEQSCWSRWCLNARSGVVSFGAKRSRRI